LRAAGVRVANFCDTDGLIGYRHNPRAALRRMIVYQQSWLDQLRCLKFWLQKVLFHAPAVDAEMVLNLELSDVAILSNPETQRLVKQFLARKGRRELSDRTAAIPPPVHELYCATNLPAVKPPRFVAVGRWDDPAKHGELLAAALDRYVRTAGSAEVVVVGPGGERLFRPLAARHQKVRYLGFQPREALAPLLADSRGIIFTSRWEGGPNAANEMLAAGGTVIGPPLPALIGLVDGNRYGRVAASRRPADLAAALAAEGAAWNAGERDPAAIAAYWRERLHPTAVCSRVLDRLAGAGPDPREGV
jgi:hypothetical protein